VTQTTEPGVAETTTSSAPPGLSPATPYASQPAAGICAQPGAEHVEVIIYPDIPDPRCVVVGAHQRLRITNRTSAAIEATLGDHTISVEPSTTVEFSRPLGEYLAAGVHALLVRPCCGPEIVLRASP
jgi:hypothetical protein